MSSSPGALAFSLKQRGRQDTVASGTSCHRVTCPLAFPSTGHKPQYRAQQMWCQLHCQPRERGP